MGEESNTHIGEVRFGRQLYIHLGETTRMSVIAEQSPAGIKNSVSSPYITPGSAKQVNKTGRWERLRCAKLGIFVTGPVTGAPLPLRQRRSRRASPCLLLSCLALTPLHLCFPVVFCLSRPRTSGNCRGKQGEERRVKPRRHGTRGKPPLRRSAHRSASRWKLVYRNSGIGSQHCLRFPPSVMSSRPSPKLVRTAFVFAFRPAVCMHRRTTSTKTKNNRRGPAPLRRQRI